MPSDKTLKAIKGTMLRHYLDQTAMAFFLGVTPQAVSQWMSGRRAPGPTVERLVEVLGLLEGLHPATHAALIKHARLREQLSRKVSHKRLTD